MTLSGWYGRGASERDKDILLYVSLLGIYIGTFVSDGLDTRVYIR